jgi:Tol biopolymer transport system component
MADLRTAFRALDELPLPDGLQRFDLVEPIPAHRDPRRTGRRAAVGATALVIALAGFLLARHAWTARERPADTQPSPRPGLLTGATPPHGSVTFDAIPPYPRSLRRSELAFVDANGGVVPMTNAWDQRLVAGDAMWSPDGSRVAFVLGRKNSWRFTGDGDLVVMNADGSGFHRLTHGLGVTSPTWSADGTHVAFVRDQGTALCTIRADGSDLRVIASQRGYYQHPRWSPAGSLIVYQSRVDTSETGDRTFVIRPDGTGERMLPSWLVGGSYPSWSPDGRRLAYSDGVGIAILDLGSGRTIATLPHCGRCEGDMFPAWSPDGRSIAFVRDSRRGRSTLFVFDLETRTLTRLGPPGTQQFAPTWRP